MLENELTREQLARPTIELTHFLEKTVGDRLNTLVTDPQLMRVHQAFGGEVFRRSSVYHGLGKFLKDNRIKGKCCFEIGSWNGLTAIILARHFKRVVTVDIVHNKIKHDIVRELGITNIEFVDIRDNEHKAHVAREVQFDFAYLDGDHANDTLADFNLTKRCGRILFHECWNFQPPVWELVQALPPEEVVYGGAGLALWRGNGETVRLREREVPVPEIKPEAAEAVEIDHE